MTLICSLYILIFAYIYTFLWLPLLRAQSPDQLSARALDSILQNYAFRAFIHPKTGIPYDGNAPPNLSGIEVSALRLRSGSLRKRGFNSYKEFQIPIGVVEQPYVERVVLVYHNLANWSTLYYPLPPSHTFLSPVLGLLAYNGSDLIDITLSELDIRASEKPILINFTNVKLPPSGSLPICVFFGLDGSLEFNKLVGNYVCSTFKQGHFSIVFESNALSPDGGSNLPPPGSNTQKKHEYEVWVIFAVGGVALVVVVVLLLGALAVYVKRCRRRKRIYRMEQRAEESVWLQMKSTGNWMAPMACATRTRPVLEDEHVH